MVVGAYRWRSDKGIAAGSSVELPFVRSACWGGWFAGIVFEGDGRFGCSTNHEEDGNVWYDRYNKVRLRRWYKEISYISRRSSQSLVMA